MRVLIAEDDPAISQSIELRLKCDGFATEIVSTGRDAVDLAKVCAWDLIILDLTLPDFSGYDVLRQLRDCKIKTPIMVLLSIDSVVEAIKALGLGADDCMKKPFHTDELIARLHAIIRRSNGHAQSTIAIGSLIVDIERKLALFLEKIVPLTPKEYQVVELLAMRKGATVTKDMVLNHLYGGIDEPDQKIVDVFLCKIRRKLKEISGGKDFVETVWGRGYSMRDG